MILLNGVTVDTDGADAFLANPSGRGFKHNLYSFYVWSSNFGGGTVTLQVSPDGVNWFTARDEFGGQAILTISDVITVFLRAHLVRARLTGSAGAAAVTAFLI